MSQKTLKELNRIKSNQLGPESNNRDIVTKQLLLDSHNEDLEIYRSLGLSGTLNYESKHAKDYKRSKRVEEIYSKPSFTGTQIKELCNKYHLKMLTLSNYNGTIPPELGRKLREFDKSNKDVNLKDTMSFFILAPYEQFQLIDHVPINDDPILFWRVGNSYISTAQENDDFLVVHGWGNDFSEFRRLKKYFSTTIESDNDFTPLFTTYLSIGLTIIFLVPAIFENSFLSIMSIFLIWYMRFFMFSFHCDELWNKNSL